MKTTLNILLLGGALLLASATESRALPPRPHGVSGVIKAIDDDAHTITLAPSKGDKPLVFVWKDCTRFSQGWSRICLGALEPGQPVKVHYRRDWRLLRQTDLMKHERDNRNRLGGLDTVGGPLLSGTMLRRRSPGSRTGADKPTSSFQETKT